MRLVTIIAQLVPNPPPSRRLPEPHNDRWFWMAIGTGVIGFGALLMHCAWEVSTYSWLLSIGITTTGAAVVAGGIVLIGHGLL